ncbi:MAG: hypothetical protein JW785_04825 [Acidimicrobiia bacterium]|nr:hypothetical protein [Acidimicrobiia bacterium]
MRRHKWVILAVGAMVAVGLAGGVAVPAAEALITCHGVAITLAPGTLLGTLGDDVMLGTAADDVMYGYGGDDIICGGDGSDRIYGGPGNDILVGGSGRDRLYGQGGRDWLKGEWDEDTLYPGSGTGGTLEGGARRDRFVITGEGDNDIFGGPGVDTIDLRRAPVAMRVHLAQGHYDSLAWPPIGSLVFEVENVIGSAYDDQITGNNRRNVLRGLDGSDLLSGRGGDDVLIGGTGFNTLNGGPGTDACSSDDIASLFISCEGAP